MTFPAPSALDDLLRRRVQALDSEICIGGVDPTFSLHGNPNRREVAVEGIHHVREGSPVEIGQARRDFVGKLGG